MASTRMDDAIEWQPVGRNSRTPLQSALECSHPPKSPYHPTAQPTAAAVSAPAPRHPQSQDHLLIDLDATETRLAATAVFDASNPFAALDIDEPDSLSSPTFTQHTNGPPSPQRPVTPAVPVPEAHKRITSGTPTDGGLLQPRRLSSPSNIDDLRDLDSSFFQTSSRGSPVSPSTGEMRKNESCPSDENLLPMARDEDMAWFEAQMHGSASHKPPGAMSTDTSRRNGCQPIHSDHSGARPTGLSRTMPRGPHNQTARNITGLSSRGGLRKRDDAHNVDRAPVKLPIRRHTSHGSPVRQHPDVSSNQFSGRYAADRVARSVKPESHIRSLAAHHDTAATTEWRKTKMHPGAFIALPRLNLAGLNVRTKPGSKPAIARPAEIALITDTHIEQVWMKHRGEGTAGLVIYGSEEAVGKARTLIKEWLAEIQEHGSDRWAKVWGYDRNAERKLRKRLHKDEERRKYRQTKSDDEVLAYKAVFAWPLPKEPERILGASFEALDTIRMNHECYITCERDGGTRLLIQGNDREKVDDALKRLRHIPAEWYAKVFEAEPFIVLDVPCVSVPDDLPPVSRSSRADGVILHFKRPPRQSESSLAVPKDSPASKLSDAISKTTQHARYFRNHLALSCRLGTLVTRRTHRPDMSEDTYSFSAFAEMLDEYGKMDASVSMEIGDGVLESKVLERCLAASHVFFVPVSGTRKTPIVKPAYCATFEIANTTGPAGDLLLDVEISSADGTVDLVSKRWSQLAKGKREPRKLLDGSITSLQKDGLAWHLELLEYLPVDEHALSPNCRVFPETLGLDEVAASNIESGRDFIIYRTRRDKTLTIPIKSVYQRRCWRFPTKAKMGEWVVEVAHVSKTTFRKGTQPALSEPRWTFNVYHNTWNLLLSSNAGVEIGQEADWGHGDPRHLLFPLNPNMAPIKGVAKQDRPYMSDSSDSEGDGGAATPAPSETLHEDVVSEEPYSARNFEQLLDLLHTLTKVVTDAPVKGNR